MCRSSAGMATGPAGLVWQAQQQHAHAPCCAHGHARGVWGACGARLSRWPLSHLTRHPSIIPPTLRDPNHRSQPSSSLHMQHSWLANHITNTCTQAREARGQAGRAIQAGKGKDERRQPRQGWGRARLRALVSRRVPCVYKRAGKPWHEEDGLLLTGGPSTLHLPTTNQPRTAAGGGTPKPKQRLMISKLVLQNFKVGIPLCVCV